MSEQPAEFSMPTPGSFQDPERSGLSADDLFAGITEHLFFTLGKLAPSATRHDLYMALSYAVRDRLMTGIWPAKKPSTSIRPKALPTCQLNF